MAKLPLVGLIRFVQFVTNFLKIHCHCQMPWNSINFCTNYLIFASFVSICCFLFHSDYYLVLNQKAFETYPNFSVSCISEILSSFTHSSMWLSGLLSFCKPVVIMYYIQHFLTMGGKGIQFFDPYFWQQVPRLCLCSAGVKIFWLQGCCRYIKSRFNFILYVSSQDLWWLNYFRETWQYSKVYFVNVM